MSARRDPARLAVAAALRLEPVVVPDGAWPEIREWLLKAHALCRRERLVVEELFIREEVRRLDFIHGTEARRSP